MNRRRKVGVFLLIALIASANVSLACSCPWRGSFSEMANDNSELVIRARVVEYGELYPYLESVHESMTVEVLESVKGKTKHGTLTLLGDDGIQCRPYIKKETFKQGFEYLFALRSESQNPQPISVCGEFWIEIHDGVAHGSILGEHGEEQYSIELNELLRQIQRNPHNKPKPD